MCFTLGCILSHKSSRRSCFPKPDTTVTLQNVPLMTPLPAVNLSSNDCDILRNYWASAYGAAVRQRTVRQETTITCIAKQGTLPEFLYQCHLEVSDTMKAVTKTLRSVPMQTKTQTTIHILCSQGTITGSTR